MTLAAILHNFAATFERVPDDLPRDIPVPQPIRQDDEEISR